MKKSFHLFVFCLLLTTPIFVKAQVNTFSKVFYGAGNEEIQANSVLPTDDNGYIVAGQSVQSGLIFKMDSACNVLWNKTYFNVLTAYSDIKLNCIIQSYDSSYIAVGDCYNPINYSRNALCIKLNYNGDTLWTKNYKPAGATNTTLLSIEQTNDSGYIMTGYISQNSSPYYKVFVAKADISGNLQWANQLACGNNTNIGYSVKQTSDSGYTLSGYFENHYPNNISSFLIKLTKTGVISWSKSYQTNPEIYQMGGFDVAIMPDGFILYSAGTLIKTDFAGNVLWSKFYVSGGGLEYLNSIAPKLHKTNDGGFVFISNSSCGHSSMIRTDSVGNLLWSDNLEIIAIDVFKTNDNGFLSIGNGPMCGAKKHNLLPQIGVIKMDSLGSDQWCNYQIYGDSSFVGTTESVPCEFTAIVGATENPVHPHIDSINIESSDGCVERFGGVEENESNNDISINPNPTSGKINLVVSQHFGEIKTIEIYNCIGQLQLKKTDDFSDMDISLFTDGLYFIVITNYKGEKLATKVIKV